VFAMASRLLKRHELMASDNDLWRMAEVAAAERAMEVGGDAGAAVLADTAGWVRINRGRLLATTALAEVETAADATDEAVEAAVAEVLS
jgi:uncharacterized phage protein gp47/JayE